MGGGGIACGVCPALPLRGLLGNVGATPSPSRDEASDDDEPL